MAGVKAVAFDKTGTLTVGKPAVTDIVPGEGLSEDDLLRVAASVEARSEHPLAKAVVKAANERQLALAEVTDFEALPGRGIKATLDGATVNLGSPAYLKLNGDFP